MWARFTKSEQKILIFIMCVLSIGFGIRELQHKMAKSNYKGYEIETIERTASHSQSIATTADGSVKIDINRATMEELDCLPGVGEVRAESIVKYRQQNGPFRTIKDLDNVPGIGELYLKRLEPHITVEGAESVDTMMTAQPITAAMQTPVSKTPEKSTPVILSDKVNINNATPQELMLLKGIGRAKADTIIKHRNTHGKFQHPMEIQKVKGIGQKIYNDNSHIISVK